MQPNRRQGPCRLVPVFFDHRETRSQFSFRGVVAPNEEGGVVESVKGRTNVPMNSS